MRSKPLTIKDCIKIYPVLRKLLLKPKSHFYFFKKFKENNWQALFDIILKNKLSAFLSHLILCSACKKKVPLKWQKKFKNLYLSQLLVNKALQKEKNVLNKVLKRKGIKVIELKNVSKLNVLPAGIFNNQTDIDFLANITDKNRLTLVLKHLNFKLVNKIPPSLYSKPFVIPENQYKKRGSFETIEIKFKPLPPSNSKINPLNNKKIDYLSTLFWKNVKKPGINFLLQEHELLFLILHFFFKDNLQGLKALYNIHMIISKKSKKINFKYILHLSKQLQITNYIIFTLMLSKKMFKTKLSKLITNKRNLKINVALYLFNPALSCLVLSPSQKNNKLLFKNIKSYFSFINLLLTKNNQNNVSFINKSSWFITKILPFWCKMKYNLLVN
jgi:hypothetical protein